MSMEAEHKVLQTKLLKIKSIASDGMKSVDATNQQKSIEDVKSAKEEFSVWLETLTPEERKIALEGLTEVTYDFDKQSSQVGFGMEEQSQTIPKEYARDSELLIFDNQGEVVKSANKTQKARFRNSGGLVFRKAIKSGPANIETTVAAFISQTLGSGSTSHGKNIVQKNPVTNKDEVVGMYVEAIPGFISMRELTDIAQSPMPTVVIGSKIDRLIEEIAKLDDEISQTTNNEQSLLLAAKRKEKLNLCNTWQQILDKNIVGQGVVNLDNVADVISKALCCAYFYQDWDRHKDNFGFSIRYDDNGNQKLDVASLDYDKSLSGIFFQDHKAYDWQITPQRLQDFPNFNCWYWPTSNEKVRRLAATIMTPDKVPKMYTAEEARRYAALKNNKLFMRQANIEWLKLMFIPLELRQNTVDKLVSNDCDPRLKKVPKYLERRRKELLNAAVQLKSFRDFLQQDPKALGEVREELKKNLAAAGFDELFLNKKWDKIEIELEVAIKKVEEMEKVAEKKCPLLMQAIKKTGISFAPDKLARIEKVLASINVKQKSRTICNMLNRELGLNISPSDARSIKQDLYIKNLYDIAPELHMILGEQLQPDKNILKMKRPYKTSYGLDLFAIAMREYRGIRLNRASPVVIDEALEKAVRCLEDLGIKKIINRETLKTLLQSSVDPQGKKHIKRQRWGSHHLKAPEQTEQKRKQASASEEIPRHGLGE